MELPPEKEKPKKTIEDYIVKSFSCNNDITLRPLTVVRSGQDGRGVRLDKGWFPGEILYVCDTDSEEGVGEGALILRVHKLIRVVREGGKIDHDILTKNVGLERIQEQEDNAYFDNDYVRALFGMTPGEMVIEGKKEAEKVWTQKHPANAWKALSPTDTGADYSNAPELDNFPERVQELMKPLKTDVNGVPFEDDRHTKTDYDYLFDPCRVQPESVESAAVRNPEGSSVSENSFKAAEKFINSLTANLSLMQIIDPERTFDNEGIMNRIRGDHVTRCRLFEYLSSRLDRLAVVDPGALPDRVFHNPSDNLKSSNYYVRGHYKSKIG